MVTNTATVAHTVKTTQMEHTIIKWNNKQTTSNIESHPKEYTLSTKKNDFASVIWMLRVLES